MEPKCFITFEVWCCLMPFLGTRARYKISHTCGEARRLALSRYWEAVAMLDFLKEFGPRGSIQRTAGFPPFSRGGLDSPLRCSLLHRHLRNWHIAYVRCKKCLHDSRGQVSTIALPGPVVIRVQKRPASALEYHALAAALCLESDAWQLLERFWVEYCVPLEWCRPGVVEKQPAFQIIRKMRADPNWRERYLSCLLPMSDENVEGVQGQAAQSSPTAFHWLENWDLDQVFSFPFISDQPLPPPDLSQRRSAHTRRLRHLAADIRATITRLGFKPYLTADPSAGFPKSNNPSPTLEQPNNTSNEISSYIQITFFSYPRVLILTGENACEIRLPDIRYGGSEEFCKALRSYRPFRKPISTTHLEE
eukprot:Protomagalhaensia_sp_Gyna_25__1900@NODE_2006_length_1351_cov_29_205030_g1653_i0_p1_GENE_NODE_2006_length_1351_cov_29_205030_g1653_i0NODE_2006_length_1351_cov_29_205030_g1653_i0_p1_ORF_typecomplete_len363_score25_97Fboxlike/PF12937_7/2_2Fboxlike/PF12937_7/3_2e02_NODE_2006_length_1351_cov_29_205030_g1653_i01111199